MSESKHNEGLEVHETFKIAPEFAPHVTVTEETFFSHGWQPLTITILQSLWFLPVDATFDIPFLVDWYARLGWKGANGKPLGANVVRREIGLIREAGYVTVARLRGESGKAVGIQYSVSQRRTDQPQDGAWIPALPGAEQSRRSHHMSPMATRGESPHVVNEETRRSDHVPPMTARGESPHVVNGAKQQVAPHATNGVSPPLPPGGGTTPPPTPSSDGARPEQAEEEVAFGDEELAAAVAFLQQLPDPWFVGEDDARKLAPKLLTQMRRKEWPGFLETTDADRKALQACLTANPGGMNNPVSILSNRRIPNLPPYSRAARRSRRDAKPAEGMCARHLNWPEDDCMSCQTEERARRKRPRSEPASVDGAGLLARLRAGLPAE